MTSTTSDCFCFCRVFITYPPGWLGSWSWLIAQTIGGSRLRKWRKAFLIMPFLETWSCTICSKLLSGFTCVVVLTFNPRIGGNLSMCGVLTVICRLCRPLWFKPLRCGAKISFCITLITLSRRHLSSAPTLKAPRELAFSFWCERIFAWPNTSSSAKRYYHIDAFIICRSNKTLPISFCHSQSAWTMPLSNRLVHRYY